MKRLTPFAVSFLIGLSSPSYAERVNPVANAMRTAGVETALIFPGMVPDEFPLWSPDSTKLALNPEGQWISFDLNGLELGLADWHGDKIGIIESIGNPEPSHLDEETSAAWIATSNHSARKVTTTEKFTVELRSNGLSTMFVTGDPAGKETQHWVSDLENCHSMSVSPDQTVVTFICEMNGVFAWLVPN